MDKFSWAQVYEWLIIGGAGMFGRLLFHAKQVQAGQRKAFSWVLFWDIPIAVSMGWIALGVATYLDLAWRVTVSLAMVMSYLGPYLIDTIFSKWQDGSLINPFKGKK